MYQFDMHLYTRSRLFVYHNDAYYYQLIRPFLIMNGDNKKEIRTISVKIPLRVLFRADRCVEKGLFGSRNDLILNNCRELFYEVRNLIDENDGLIGPTKYNKLSEISLKIKQTQRLYRMADDEESKQIIFRISQPFASTFESLLKLMDLSWSEIICYSLLRSKLNITIQLDSIDEQTLHDKIKEGMAERRIPEMDDSDYTDDVQ